MDHADILISDECSEAGTTVSDSTIRAPIVKKTGIPSSISSPASFDQPERCCSFQSPSDSTLQTRRGRHEAGKRLELLSHSLKDLQAFGIPSSKRSTSHYRDTPIYTEPGSPLLGQAYYASTHPVGPYSPIDVPQSPRSIYAYSDSIVIDTTAKATPDLFLANETKYEGVRDSFQNHPYSPSLSAVQDNTDHRISALSFQCVGDLFRDEAAWLSSPLNWWNRSESGCLPYILSQNMPSQQIIDPLSNDNSSCIDEEEEEEEEEETGDLLACATALAPAKASVINVNSQLSIQVPPRSSSLGTTVLNSDIDSKAHGSWMTFGDCQDSDSDSDFDSDDSDDSSLHSKAEPFIKPFWQPSLSQRVIDPAIPSPPLSPTPSSTDDFNALNISISPQQLIRKGSSYPIMASLEDHVTAFPTPMLLADSACTFEIRKFLRSPPDCPPSPANSDEWTFENHHPDSQIHKEPMNHWQPLRNKASRLLPGPDLEPLRRTFPDTSNFMRSALYAHLLSYIFVTSTPIASLASRGMQPRHQQSASASSIPSKAASLLGMDEAGSHKHAGPHHGETESLKSRLRDNIERIISGIEGSFEVDGARFGRASTVSPAFFRSLVEMVRLSEGL